MHAVRGKAKEGVVLLLYAWSLIVNLDSSRGRVVLPGRMVITGGTPVKIYPVSAG